MGHKRYVRILLVFLVVFTGYNFLVWEFYTQRFFDRYDTSKMGDLARMGYLPEHGVSKRQYFDLPRRHIEYDEYEGEEVDLLTIGDSFSMGIGGGPNQFYQDYIATYNDLSVLSLIAMDAPNMETVWKLMNSGMLDRISPRYVVLQSVERSALPRYGDRPADAAATATIEELDRHFRDGAKLAALEVKGARQDEPVSFSIRFINLVNLKYPLYQLLYRYVNRPPGAEAYLFRLDRPLFNSAFPEDLVVYFEDIKAVKGVHEGRVMMLNENMNRVADALAARGIKFYFMPVLDKYTLYGPYIKDNKYPRSRFFELLRKQERRYGLIDTEAILSRVVAEGAMDVFHPDDTHWSSVASERVFSEFRFQGTAPHSSPED